MELNNLDYAQVALSYRRYYSGYGGYIAVRGRGQTQLPTESTANQTANQTTPAIPNLGEGGGGSLLDGLGNFLGGFPSIGERETTTPGVTQPPAEETGENFIRIDFPADGEVLTQQSFTVRGSVSPDATKIVILVYGFEPEGIEESGIYRKLDEYTLTKFKPGDTEWSYRVDPQYGNFWVLGNRFVARAYFSDGTTREATAETSYILSTFPPNQESTNLITYFKPGADFVFSYPSDWVITKDELPASGTYVQNISLDKKVGGSPEDDPIAVLLVRNSGTPIDQAIEIFSNSLGSCWRPPWISHLLKTQRGRDYKHTITESIDGNITIINDFIINEHGFVIRVSYGPEFANIGNLIVNSIR